MKTRPPVGLALAVALPLGLAACDTVTETASQEPAEDNTFVIYLVASSMSSDQLSKPDLNFLDLEDEPLLSIEDIVAYTQATHEIELTPAAYERIEQLDVPVSGRPFVVCVGRTRIYGGAFWTLLSSLSFDGVVIQVPLAKEYSAQIQVGYPGADFFTGKDPRSDPRILQSLEQAGKLR